jgi:hypothetical protein
MNDKRQNRLRLRRAEADAYSRANNLDRWGVRVAWFITREGVDFARRFCMKFNMRSPARACYMNLLKAGLIVEGPKSGLVYNKMPKWEKGDGPLLWLRAVAHVATGGKPDPDLFRHV